MNTRHLYTFQDGEVVVLEHITTIGTITEGDEQAAKDVKFEKMGRTPTYYKTT